MTPEPKQQPLFEPLVEALKETEAAVTGDCWDDESCYLGVLEELPEREVPIEIHLFIEDRYYVYQLQRRYRTHEE